MGVPAEKSTWAAKDALDALNEVAGVLGDDPKAIYAEGVDYLVRCSTVLAEILRLSLMGSHDHDSSQVAFEVTEPE